MTTDAGPAVPPPGSVITDEEAAALLERRTPKPGEARPLDLAKLRISHGRLPMLEVLHQTFVGLYRTSIGGRGTAREVDRAITPAEQRFGQMLIRQMFADLKKAWAPVAQLEFEVTRNESNPAFVSIASPGEGLLVNRFLVELPNGSGTIDFAIPEPMFESLRNQGGAPKNDSSANWPAVLREHLRDAVVEVRGASVVHLFMKAGMDPKRLEIIGLGEFRPVADNGTLDGRNTNRRVRIVILEGTGVAEEVYAAQRRDPKTPPSEEERALSEPGANRHLFSVPGEELQATGAPQSANPVPPAKPGNTVYVEPSRSPATTP